jgi:hypothetical protein
LRTLGVHEATLNHTLALILCGFLNDTGVTDTVVFLTIIRLLKERLSLSNHNLVFSLRENFKGRRNLRRVESIAVRHFRISPNLILSFYFEFDEI